MAAALGKIQQFVTISGGDSGRRQDRAERVRTLFRMLVGDTPCIERRAGATHLVVACTRPDEPQPSIGCGHGKPFLFRAGSPIHTARGDFDANALLAAAQSAPVLARALEHYDGQFALLACRGDTCSPLLVTDPLGQFHVYTARQDGLVFHSSSSLLLAALTASDFDGTSVREFVARGNCFSDRTLFSTVRKLPGASVIDLDASAEAPPSRYWQLADALPQNTSAGTGVKEVGERLRDCITALRSQYPRPVFDLTGGFDSRIIYGAARQQGAADPPSTTVAGAPGDADVRCATQIAARFGSPHHTVSPLPGSVNLWQAAKDCLALTDGEYDLLEYAGIHAVQQRMRQRFGLSVNGSGGGLLQGYWWELLKPGLGEQGDFPFERVAARRLAPAPQAVALLKHTFNDSLADHFRDLAVAVDQPVSALPNTARMDHLLLRMRVQRWQGRIASSTSRFQDVVSPFLLRPVLEAVLDVPARRRDRGKACRLLLQELDPALARMPLDSGMPATPLTATTWPAHAVTGAQSAFRRVLMRARPNRIFAERATRIQVLLANQEVQDYLDMDHMRMADLFNAEQLEDVIQGACRGSAWNTTQLGRVLTLEHTARTLEKEGGYNPAVRF
ncbi:hypothetical protein SADO_15579 [Salinisphaera dokdonensis CL-ES53]|uniref:asparagine synthase (glutamine-hydrolyzing) n=2 Tax=Salinisphaera TaxID=180541 RepID=A0ABV2B465_9GAMM